MRRLFSVKSRTKFVVAAAVLSAAMLAFIGDASAETKDAGKDGHQDVRVSWVLPARYDVSWELLLHGNGVR